MLNAVIPLSADTVTGRCRVLGFPITVEMGFHFGVELLEGLLDATRENSTISKAERLAERLQSLEVEALKKDADNPGGSILNLPVHLKDLKTMQNWIVSLNRLLVSLHLSHCQIISNVELSLSQAFVGSGILGDHATFAYEHRATTNPSSAEVSYWQDQAVSLVKLRCLRHLELHLYTRLQRLADRNITCPETQKSFAYSILHLLLYSVWKVRPKSGFLSCIDPKIAEEKRQDAYRREALVCKTLWQLASVTISRLGGTTNGGNFWETLPPSLQLFHELGLHHHFQYKFDNMTSSMDSLYVSVADQQKLYSQGFDFGSFYASAYGTKSGRAEPSAHAEASAIKEIFPAAALLGAQKPRDQHNFLELVLAKETFLSRWGQQNKRAASFVFSGLLAIARRSFMQSPDPDFDNLRSMLMGRVLGIAEYKRFLHWAKGRPEAEETLLDEYIQSFLIHTLGAPILALYGCLYHFGDEE